jgi:polysaccharide pyruvyl transferase WcaK-like protein
MHISHKRSTRKSKKGGAASAADYGTYVWGTNQVANPAGGNVIQIANHPLTPAKTGGSAEYNNLMRSMLEPQKPIMVVSQSLPEPVTGGRTRRRKNKRRRMSKRKYIRK